MKYILSILLLILFFTAAIIAGDLVTIKASDTSSPEAYVFGWMLFWSMLITVVIAAYFLPTYFAIVRKYPQRFTIAVLNF